MFQLKTVAAGAAALAMMASAAMAGGASEIITARPARSPPNAIFAISTASSARSGAVTGPMNDMSE